MKSINLTELREDIDKTINNVLSAAGERFNRDKYLLVLRDPIMARKIELFGFKINVTTDLSCPPDTIYFLKKEDYERIKSLESVSQKLDQ